MYDKEFIIGMVVIALILSLFLFNQDIPKLFSFTEGFVRDRDEIERFVRDRDEIEGFESSINFNEPVVQTGGTVGSFPVSIGCNDCQQAINCPNYNFTMDQQRTCAVCGTGGGIGNVDGRSAGWIRQCRNLF